MSNFAKYLLKNSENEKKKVFLNQKIRYSELTLIIKNFYQNVLRNHKNQIIGLSIDLSDEFLILYLSIIYSGNTVILLERGLSNERYIEICKEFKVNFLFIDKKIENKNLKIIKDDFNEFNFNQSLNQIKLYSIFQKRKSLYINKDVAIIMLTSGSTGLKKGVMLTHQNLISNTNSILKSLPIKKTHIVNLPLPVSYSYGLSVLNSHLKIKAKIYIHNSPYVGSIVTELKNFKCNSFYGVPSTFEILMTKTNFMKEKYHYLDYISQAGGPLSISMKKKLIEKFKNKFYVMYGTTETSPRLSVISGNKLKSKINSIGKPIAGVKFKLIKIKNSKNYELAAKGKNIMKGYFGDPALTKRKIKNGYFLTGDIAYKDKDGYYYIKKRLDKIIKRYGFKVNLNLVENTVKKITYVKYVKIFLSSEDKLILIVQTKKNMFKKTKKLIEKNLSIKFARYEIPDEIILTNKSLISYKRKLSLEEIYKLVLK